MENSDIMAMGLQENGIENTEANTSSGNIGGHCRQLGSNLAYKVTGHSQNPGADCSASRFFASDVSREMINRRKALQSTWIQRLMVPFHSSLKKRLWSGADSNSTEKRPRKVQRYGDEVLGIAEGKEAACGDAQRSFTSNITNRHWKLVDMPDTVRPIVYPVQLPIVESLLPCALDDYQTKKSFLPGISLTDMLPCINTQPRTSLSNKQPGVDYLGKHENAFSDSEQNLQRKAECSYFSEAAAHAFRWSVDTTDIKGTGYVVATGDGGRQFEAGDLTKEMQYEQIVPSVQSDSAHSVLFKSGSLIEGSEGNLGSGEQNTEVVKEELLPSSIMSTIASLPCKSGRSMNESRDSSKSHIFIPTMNKEVELKSGRSSQDIEEHLACLHEQKFSYCSTAMQPMKHGLSINSESEKDGSSLDVVYDGMPIFYNLNDRTFFQRSEDKNFQGDLSFSTSGKSSSYQNALKPLRSDNQEVLVNNVSGSSVLTSGQLVPINDGTSSGVLSTSMGHGRSLGSINNSSDEPLDDYCKPETHAVALPKTMQKMWLQCLSSGAEVISGEHSVLCREERECISEHVITDYPYITTAYVPLLRDCEHAEKSKNNLRKEDEDDGKCKESIGNFPDYVSESPKMLS
eukprot:c25812_g1_i1 orf=585-2471(+)